jgi:hypothetical protein
MWWFIVNMIKIIGRHLGLVARQQLRKEPFSSN